MENFGYLIAGYERKSLLDYIGYEETGEKSPALIVDYSNNEMYYGDRKLSKLTQDTQEFFVSADFIRNEEVKDLTK